jgi:WASH complex subunit strumpellin
MSDGNFLSEDNLCGQTLLRLTSRGSSILAELFRLSKKIPSSFLVRPDNRDALSAKYSSVVFDFNFFKTPELFERRINDSDELLDLDDEFQETHMVVIDRFYTLFEVQHDTFIRYSPFTVCRTYTNMSRIITNFLKI